MTVPRPPEADLDPYDAAHRVVFPGDGEPAEGPAPATPDGPGALTAAGAAPLIRKVIY
jgi:hypothetical protein